MKKPFLILVSLVLLVGLPMTGVYLFGYRLNPYLEFPPETRYVEKLPFSPIAFILLALLILIIVLPFFLRAFRHFRHRVPQPPARRFPWWGLLGLIFLIISWILAWSRFDGYSALQPHTFPLLWIGYIVVMNALAFRRTGRCPLTHRTGLLLVLFPISAVFWWFFEYLNRFVQNWYYQGVHYDAWTYFWLATLSFSTVLPAFLSTFEWVRNHGWLDRAFANAASWRPSRPKLLAGLTFGLAGAGLLLIGRFPDFLFPLLWVAPLIVITSLQAMADQPHIFSGIADGDWRLTVTSALAALICGFFWELWNIHSLAKWVYDIPLVHRFQLFEMPILGYAGYLPFGIECAAIIILITGLNRISTDQISASTG